MASPVALVQGASRGLGLQFCRHILMSRPDAQIIATCRNPQTAHGLNELKERAANRITVLPLDVTKEDNIAGTAKIVKESHGKIDLMVNSAAMLHPSGRGETSIAAVNGKDQAIMFATNSTGPLLMAKHFKGLLLKGTGEFGHQGLDAKSQHSAVIANISARVGSISDNGLGGWYAYRMSKAALNMATRNLSIELGRGKSKVVCVVLHPGTVETDLSRPYHKGVPSGKLFSAEYSVNSLMTVINGANVANTGKYFAWDGSEIPY